MDSPKFLLDLTILIHISIRERRELQANPLTYNGAEREGYFWSQNIMEVDVRVKVR